MDMSNYKRCPLCGGTNIFEYDPTDSMRAEYPNLNPMFGCHDCHMVSNYLNVGSMFKVAYTREIYRPGDFAHESQC